MATGYCLALETISGQAISVISSHQLLCLGQAVLPSGQGWVLGKGKCE